VAALSNRLKHAWNAFNARDETDVYVYKDLGIISSQNPGRPRLSPGSERSIIATVTNRIALDVASFDFQHVKLDKDGRYLETVNDSLHQCLTVEANKDQTGRAFIQDVVMSMFDEGCVAIVPVEADIDPRLSNSYEIYSLRTGKIIDWFPDHVRVDVYNDRKGVRERIIVPKNMVAIIENPLYAIMNEPNSTLKRLVRKLNLLDVVDDKTSSGKLDLIIQLPYSVKSETRQKQAEERINAISRQLQNSNYGIAYADATERITQLNRPVENNLLTQIQYLTNTFYNQLGMTEDIFTGKATPQTLRAYYDRTIEPIVTTIVDELRRKFLTKTARTQGHSIMAFRDIFRLVPASELAEIADVFSRNEILSANELRQIIGRKPSDDPRANELSNKNMPQPTSKPQTTAPKIKNETPPEGPKISREDALLKIDRLKRDLELGKVSI
jgi:hypothetical protein